MASTDFLQTGSNALGWLPVRTTEEIRIAAAEALARWEESKR